jgi:hypothetical protein
MAVLYLFLISFLSLAFATPVPAPGYDGHDGHDDKNACKLL